MLIGQDVFNAGVLLHRAYHVLRKSAWDHGVMGRMRLGYAMKLARARGLAILEHGYFDVPIFVLDLYEIGPPLRRSFVGRSSRDLLLKESPFENLPRAFKPVFSHYWYLLCQPN